MAIQSNFPALSPSLDLNFAGSRTVDPRITFSRASSATYFDEKGVMHTAPAGVPRINHDPVTGECKGLLIEEQRTNLLTYSEQFDNEAWSKLSSSTVTPNSTVAPDGTLTGNLLLKPASSYMGVYNFVASSAGAAYCGSVYVKAESLGDISLELFASSSSVVIARGSVNLTTGALTNVTGSGLLAATQLNNGWWRVAIQGAATEATIRFIVYPGVASNSVAGGVYIWGAQLEAGSFPTSYIKTVASQVTRAADNAVMAGTNFSDWYRQDEGTFVVGFSSPVHRYPATAHVFSVNSGGYTETGGVFISPGLSTSSEYYARATLGLGVTPANTKARVATAYKADDFAASLGGATPITDTSGVPLMPNRLHLGIRYDNDRALNGHVSKLTYYPKRLTNEQLQALTA